MVRSQKFGPHAKNRFLMAGMTTRYIDKKSPLPLKGNGKLRKFFCVYLVGFLLQAAESEQFFTHLKEKYKNSPQFKAVPVFNNLSNSAKGKLLRGHSEHVRKNFSKALESFVQMKFDAETVNPRWFREFTLNNPKIFEDVARIIAPASKK
jgi:hypothetical protein